MKSKRIIIFFLIILLLTTFSILYPNLQKLTGHALTSDYYKTEQATLTRVVDGDTIEAQVGEEIWKIRLLGINTPEKNMPYATDAANFLRQFENKTIQLKRDNEDTDKYKRKLRYIFFNNEMLNLEIIESGFANAYYTLGLRYEQEFLNAELKARNAELGIWEKSQDVCSSCILLDTINSQDEFFIIKNRCSFNCILDGWFVKDAGRNTFYLANLSSDSTSKYSSKKEVWNNDHDQLFIFDKDGMLVLYYSY